MKSEVYFGHHCPTCNTTVGVLASVGGVARCPGCKGPLIAAAGSPRTESIANFKCEHCGTQVGLLSVVGGRARCPGCKAEIT